MRLIEMQHRPSWAELIYGPGHPAWFEELHLPRIKQLKAARQPVADAVQQRLKKSQ